MIDGFASVINVTAIAANNASQFNTQISRLNFRQGTACADINLMSVLQSLFYRQFSAWRQLSPIVNQSSINIQKNLIEHPAHFL